TKEFLAKKVINVIDHPHPTLLTSTLPHRLLLLPVMKKMLEGVEIVDKSVQKEWTRVRRAIPEDSSVRPSGSGLRDGRNVFESAEV
ncbi:Hypothetical protein FKW44_001832, partial [Caligus rogercresseyi]